MTSGYRHHILRLGRRDFRSSNARERNVYAMRKSRGLAVFSYVHACAYDKWAGSAGHAYIARLVMHILRAEEGELLSERR